jgi:heme-degrading monooxygenase HmoA
MIAAMYVIIWRYRVKPAQTDAFERHYGAAGTWVEFFRRGTGYIGTDLLRDESAYMTIDRWTSKTDYERFRSAREEEYAALDKRLESLTDSEERVGEYESVL